MLKEWFYLNDDRHVMSSCDISKSSTPSYFSLTLKKYVKSKFISYLVFGNVYLCGLTYIVYREKWNALKGKALEKGIWFVLFIPRLALRSLSRLHSLITRFLFCLFSVCMSMCTCDVKSATLYSIQNFKLYI